LIYQLCSL